jgi:hypothetical protein
MSSLRTLVRSDKGCEPDKPDSLDTILEPYTVGTERSKLNRYRSKKASSKVAEYRPLRELVRKSAVQRAKDQQQQIDIRNDETNNSNEQQTGDTNLLTIPDNVTYNDKETYQNICMTICAMVICHNKKSKFEFFETLIGYKILFDRAEVDISQPLSQQPVMQQNIINQKKRQWKNALLLANSFDRINMAGRKKQLPNQITNEETILTENNDTTTNVVNLPPKDYGRYCTVCARSSANNNDATFTRLPIVGDKPSMGATDRQRKEYSKNIKRHEIYLVD